MNINEVYTRLTNNEVLLFEEQPLIDFECSNCKNHLLKIFLDKGKLTYECPQEFLYADGDTINTPKDYWLRADTSMMFGRCDNCDSNIALINTILLDKELDSEILDEGFKECFVIFNEEELIKDFKEVKQYKIILNNETIGKVVVYKNATINECAVHGLVKEVERNVALASLECLSLNENMFISDIGICNGHFENENQAEIWEKSSNIAIKFITFLDNLL